MAWHGTLGLIGVGLLLIRGREGGMGGYEVRRLILGSNGSLYC